MRLLLISNCPCGKKEKNMYEEKKIVIFLFFALFNDSAFLALLVITLFHRLQPTLTTLLLKLL